MYVCVCVCACACVCVCTCVCMYVPEISGREKIIRRGGKDVSRVG